MKYPVISFAAFMLLACTSQEPPPVARTVTFDCEGHKLELNTGTNTASYHKSNGAKPLTAVAATSGAKYASDNGHVVFWNKPEETQLIIGKRKPFACTEVK